MADYTNIPDANLIPDKPIRSIDTLALRDNPIAIAEGATGAPRVATAALKPPAAGTAHKICQILILEEEDDGGIGVAYTSPSERRIVDSPRHHAAVCLVPGAVTCSVDHRGTGTSPAGGFVRVLVNDTVITEWSDTTNIYTTRQISATVMTGDVIIFQQKSAGVASSSHWKNISIFSANPDMAVIF